LDGNRADPGPAENRIDIALSFLTLPPRWYLLLAIRLVRCVCHCEERSDVAIPRQERAFQICFAAILAQLLTQNTNVSASRISWSSDKAACLSNLSP
jgi:hypothetical protein